MKKQIEARIPTNPADLRIKHFASMALVPTGEVMHGEEGMYFLSSFTGIRYHRLLDFRADDIRKMIATARHTISKMQLNTKLPERIELAGTSYVLVDPNKIGIGWHIDFNHGAKKNWITKDPVRLACLFYLQEGFNYSDVDENDNIKFPIDSRYEVFRDHFPLDLFITASGFFLSASVNSISKRMVNDPRLSLKERISLVARVINPLRGRRLLRL